MSTEQEAQNEAETEGGRASAPLIQFFRIDLPCAPPDGRVTISWKASPGSSVGLTIEDDESQYCCLSKQPSSGTFDWIVPGSFTEPIELKISLTAEAYGKTVFESLPFHVDVTPTLIITNMEVTQGIQTWYQADGTPYNEDDNPPGNYLESVAYKDTIVRVYISADRDGFNGDLVPDVTGVLVFDGHDSVFDPNDDVGGIGPLTPINGQVPNSCGGWTDGDPFITARPRDQIDREITDHTLNFRIPSGLLTPGLHFFDVEIVAPGKCGETVTAHASMVRQWKPSGTLRVRYVRIRDDNSTNGTGTRPTQAEAMCTIARAFDLLPSSTADIGPAWQETYSTTRDLTTNAGSSGLLADLDDKHNCDFFEWATQLFGSDCPDDDGARWVGLTAPFNRGWAYRGGNTCISAMYNPAIQPQDHMLRIKTGHELGHNLGFAHAQLGCPTMPNNATYNPADNSTLWDVPFDPFWNTAISGNVGDFMSYACNRWTSVDSWNQMRNWI
jgi:hypothetical protein